MRLYSFFKQLDETMEDWGTNEWVHFSDIPQLTINPMQAHQDPTGYYFFPASFKPHGYWAAKKYKFTAVLKPGARVLDMSRITPEQINDMVDRAGPEARARFDDYVQRYPPADTTKMADMAWEMIRGTLLRRGSARWNKLIREMGYDAIFDDQKVIHTREVQLIVLNIKAMKIIRLEEQKFSLFKLMQPIIHQISEFGKSLGMDVDVEGPKRAKDRYSNKTYLVARIEISNPAVPPSEHSFQKTGNYATIMVRTDSEPRRREMIDISLSYSEPRLNYGSGAHYNAAAQSWDFQGMESMFRDLKKIFGKEDDEEQTT